VTPSVPSQFRPKWLGTHGCYLGLSCLDLAADGPFGARRDLAPGFTLDAWVSTQHATPRRPGCCLMPELVADHEPATSRGVFVQDGCARRTLPKRSAHPDPRRWMDREQSIPDDGSWPAAGAASPNFIAREQSLTGHVLTGRFCASCFESWPARLGQMQKFMNDFSVAAKCLGASGRLTANPTIAHRSASARSTPWPPFCARR
jgi:hypothetical protein